MKKNLFFAIPLMLLVLLAACSRAPSPTPLPVPELSPTSLPTPEPSPLPDMAWNVITDYTNLTPYAHPLAKHTRLHDGPLPELMPSKDYGMLLPYASAEASPDGNLQESKYGLVTKGGVIVTDLVYDLAERAAERPRSYGAPPSRMFPAYKLAVYEFDQESKRVASWHAACALDGSWVTPLEYKSIVFADDTIILLRDYETSDIDILDYNGRFLYNVRDMDWASRVAYGNLPWDVVYYVYEGIACVPGRDGKCFFVEMLTGKAHYTEYAEASPFSEGLAAVMERVVTSGQELEFWGYIDKGFELAIPTRYVRADAFFDGRAIVELPGSVKQVIDMQGETLFSVSGNDRITQIHRDLGFTHDRRDEGLYDYYTRDFVEVIAPDVALSKHNIESVWRLGGGWYTSSTRGGEVLYSLEEEYVFDRVSSIHEIYGDILVYSGYGYSSLGMDGVMTIDGEIIIPPEENSFISTIAENGNALAFIVNTHKDYIDLHDHDPEYIPSVYKLFRANGELIASGPGIMAYDEAAGLLRVLGEDYFAWLDLDGNTLISIPNLSNIKD